MRNDVGESNRHVLTVGQHLAAYLDARGIPMPEITTARKVVDEAEELVAALAGGDLGHVRQEIADVVYAAAAVAHAIGTTVEQCLVEKRKHDRGRGRGRGCRRCGRSSGELTENGCPTCGPEVDTDA